MPQSKEKNVDFPAPFGPITQRSSPLRQREIDGIRRDHAAESFVQSDRLTAQAYVPLMLHLSSRSQTACARRTSRRTIPSGANNITATSRTPMMTSAYWLPAEDST